MPEPPDGGALDRVLLSLARADPAVAVVEGSGPGGPSLPAFAAEMADRYDRRDADGAGAVRSAIRLAHSGARVFLIGASSALVGEGYSLLRGAPPGAALRLIGDPRLDVPTEAMIEDLGLLRGLPRWSVVAPPDEATLPETVRALAPVDGPVYVRRPGAGAASGPPAAFELGRARELRAGTDLTIGAVGRPVSRALEAGTELARVGIGVRVLDLASVKPLDEKAIVRAARDTGALLTLEEHSVVCGVGAAVAAMVAEEAPVPVRRLGAPDLAPAHLAGSPDPFGLALDHVLEAAYELLRQRGKVQ